MGVFHRGHLIGNYGFSEGREQCLQSWLGSVVVSEACLGRSAKYHTCLTFHQPSPTPDPNLDSDHLVTVLSCLSMSCRSHSLICLILLSSCLDTIAGLP